MTVTHAYQELADGDQPDATYFNEITAALGRVTNVSLFATRTVGQYLVFKSGTTYYVYNCGTGAIDGTYTNTNLNTVMAALTATPNRTIYVNTGGTTFTWTTDAVPANVTIEADLAASFVIKHSTPETPASYVTVGANTMLVNLSVWDYSGVELDMSPANGPRPCMYYYNATSSVMNISFWYRQFILVDIGETGVGGDCDFDRPGIGVNQWGPGDAFWAGVKDNGVGYNTFVDYGNAAGVGTGFYCVFYGAGKGVWVVAKSGCSGYPLCVSQEEDVPGLYLYGTHNTAEDIVVTTNAKTTGHMLGLYHSTTAYTGDAIYANLGTGAGSFTGNFIEFQEDSVDRFIVTADGHVMTFKAAAGAGFSVLLTGDTYERCQLMNWGLQLGPGNAGSDTNLYRNAANQWVTDDQLVAIDGLATKVVADAVDDGDFTVDTDGLLAIDSTNHRIYFRYSGGWHYCNQDAGYQIPADEKTCPLCKKAITVGQCTAGWVNDTMADGALHGLYVHLKCAMAHGTYRIYCPVHGWQISHDSGRPFPAVSSKLARMP